MPKSQWNKYRCPKCKLIVQRNSFKGWIKSYCEKTDSYSRLQLMRTK